jgi:hypothetical protein
MTYFKALSSLILGCAVAIIPSAHADTVSIFTTGVDGTGTPLAYGSQDTHYALTVTGCANQTLCDTYASTAVQNHPAWLPNTGSASWINPGPPSPTDTQGTQNYDVGATYDYTQTFFIPTADLSTLTVTGTWTSDNNSILLLNGVATGFAVNYPGYAQGSLESFTLTAADGLVAGNNTLTFEVQNGLQHGYTGGDNPTGILVTNISAATPEPSSLMLLGTGLLSACGVLRRRIVRS